jgi:hypothetical protein
VSGSLSYICRDKNSPSFPPSFITLPGPPLYGSVTRASGRGETNLTDAHPVSYYTSGKLADLVITCGEREFHVHKIILCGRSKYFAKMMEGGWKVWPL